MITPSYPYYNYYSAGVQQSPINQMNPWLLIGRDGVGASFLKGNANPKLNYNFPAVNTAIALQHNTSLITDSITVTQNSAGCSMSPAASNVAEQTVVNGTVYREASLLFQANNPSTTDPIAGIVISPASTMFAGYSATYNTSYPTYVVFGGHIWYWKFTDETFTNPASFVKDVNYGLVINLRQTVSR
jgi:hypothetical protein